MGDPIEEPDGSVYLGKGGSIHFSVEDSRIPLSGTISKSLHTTSKACEFMADKGLRDCQDTGLEKLKIF